MGIIGTSRPIPVKIKTQAKSIAADKGLYDPRLELGSSWCPRHLQHWQCLKGACCSPVLRETSVGAASLGSRGSSGSSGGHRTGQRPGQQLKSWSRSGLKWCLLQPLVWALGRERCCKLHTCGQGVLLVPQGCLPTWAASAPMRAAGKADPHNRSHCWCTVYTLRQKEPPQKRQKVRGLPVTSCSHGKGFVSMVGGLWIISEELGGLSSSLNFSTTSNMNLLSSL